MFGPIWALGTKCDNGWNLREYCAVVAFITEFLYALKGFGEDRFLTILHAGALLHPKYFPIKRGHPISNMRSKC